MLFSLDVYSMPQLFTVCHGRDLQEFFSLFFSQTYSYRIYQKEEIIVYRKFASSYFPLLTNTLL